MSRRFRSLILLSFCLLALAAACDRPAEPTRVEKPASGQGQTPVRIPETVAGKWKSVKIVAVNKETRQERLYTVDLGGEFSVPGSGLIVKVGDFLPEFVTNGKLITSASNELANPAVHVRILDSGQEVYQGWLFSLYPDAHAFQHKLYGFVLVDFVPARIPDPKKG